MRLFYGLVALLLGGIVGLGAAGFPTPPVLFPSEPLVITLPAGPPRAFYGLQPFPLNWKGTPSEHGTMWRGEFPEDAPLGLWTLKWEGGCLSFLRVPGDMAVLVVRGIPGMGCALDGEARTCDGDGIAWFLVPPGEHTLSAHIRGMTYSREVSLLPGKRREIVLAWVELAPTAGAALPGEDFLVTLKVLSPVDIPSFTLEASLPEGWGYRIRGPCVSELPCPQPVFAGIPQEIPLILSVPEGARGSYHLSIAVPELGLTVDLDLEVRACLDPLDVVHHWDTEKDDIDLSLPGEVTYGRLLWAIAYLGKAIPYACRPLGEDDIRRLTREWRGE